MKTVIFQKGVKTSEMDEGVSTNGSQPPLTHMSDRIGHNLYLQE